MSRILPLFICSTLLCPLLVYSQHCGFDQQIDHSIQADPNFLQNLEIQESLIQITSNRYRRSADTDIITVPVVVHVLHIGQAIGGGVNITDDQIKSGITQLNMAFGGEDFYTTPATGIRFELAKRAPDCSPTTGIIRMDAKSICVESDCYDKKGITQINQTAVKAASYWPSRDYLNIWVVREIEDNGAKNGIQGYAQFPGGDAATDGIVILYNAFGYQEAGGPFNLKSNTKLGAVLIHEVGHSLGLYHSFEGDDYNRDGVGDRCPSFTGCGPFNGDCIEDTPPHRRSPGTCATDDINVCDGGGPGHLFVHNFMDYSSEDCQYEFTKGQVDRMRATLHSLRSGWIYSQGNIAVQARTQTPPDCRPQTRYLANNYGLGVVEFKLGSFVHVSGNAVEDGGYVDNWCSLIPAEPGKTYDLYINTGNQNAQNVKVFADFNADGDFNDPSETIFSSEKQKVHQGKVNIPASVVKGKPIRIRSISAYSGFKITSPCFQPYFGQVEDYSMVVGSPSQAAPDDLTQSLTSDINTTFEAPDDNTYLIFPNPSMDEQVYFQTDNPKLLKRMELLDAQGKLVKDLSISIVERGQMEIDLQGVHNGIFYLRITEDEKVTVKKLSRF